MKKKALIYCSLYAKDVKKILTFQEGALGIISIKLNYEFFGMFKNQSGRGELDSYVMKKLLTHVRRKYIVTIIIWDSTRISLYPYFFEEFKMLTMLYDVETTLRDSKINQYIDSLILGIM